MATDPTALSSRAVARAAALLGLSGGDEAAAMAIALVAPPAVSVAACCAIHERIGLPSALVAAISNDAPGNMLTVDQVTTLHRAVMLYALAVETFDNENMARQWWERPISLEPGSVPRSPRDWATESEASTNLVVRMRRTLHGLL
jgi:uncharacterized protein (DUF2384 family)